jgi:hypothetical protein
MSSTNRWWRPRNLLVAWSAYWVGLILVKLSPAIAAGWRLSRQPQVHGDAGVSFGDGGIGAHIAQAGQTTWAGSVSFLSLVLLIAIPPLVLWFIWLIGASRTNNAEHTGVNAHKAQRNLYAADSRTEIIDSSTSKRRTREEI